MLQQIAQLLARNRGSIAITARELGLTRAELRRLINLPETRGRPQSLPPRKWARPLRKRKPHLLAPGDRIALEPLDVTITASMRPPGQCEDCPWLAQLRVQLTIDTPGDVPIKVVPAQAAGDLHPG
jgi:hypothetical protein